MNAKTMQWLIRREVWEHKGMLAWVPLSISAVMIAMVLGMTVIGHNATIQVDGVTTSVAGATMQMGERQQQMLAEGLAVGWTAAASVLHVALGFLVFFYSLGALYDERRDRSILFWKSLPVSDTATVVSKAAMALVGIPLVISVVELLASLVMFMIFLAGFASKGINLFPQVLSHPQFWLGPLKTISLLPVYALWALPTVGWLLLVSAWARTKVFLWAVGVPLLGVLLALWFEKAFQQPISTQWLIEKFASRLLAGVWPGTWLMASGIDVAGRAPGPAAAFDLAYRASWTAMATPEAIIGALAGIAMIAAAIWLRRHREEG